MTLAGLDLRHEPRHNAGVGADELERRLRHLLSIGFSEEGADKIFEAINLPTPEEVDRKLADLKALGYSTERLKLCGEIIGRLDDRTDGQFGRLINKPRTTIDAVAAAQPLCWSDLLAIVRDEKAKRRAA